MKTLSVIISGLLFLSSGVIRAEENEHKDKKIAHIDAKHKSLPAQ